MNQLEERLRTAGRSRSEFTPDIGSIRNRGLKIRRNRQIATSLAAVVLVVMGGIAAFDALRPESDTTVVSASEGGDATDDSDVDQPDPSADADTVDDATAPNPPTGDSDEVADSDDSAEDGADDDVEANEAGVESAPPSQSSLSDALGGWLTVTSDGIEHLRADGSTWLITFPEPPGGFAQRWPTDVVMIDGGHYLLIDQFVNRQDLAAERERMLAESYGVPYDPETEASELANVASAQEIGSLEHWEIGILAVDLATDQIITVEQRVVNSTQTPDWYYNGHITSDGSSIIVMRELWQGHCLYAEGLTLDGRPVDIVDATIYAKPQGLESMTFDEIGAVQRGEAEPPQPCRTLAELPESGLGVWGTQADPDQIQAFRTAFSEAGLG